MARSLRKEFMSDPLGTIGVLIASFIGACVVSTIGLFALMFMVSYMSWDKLEGWTSWLF